MVGRGVRDVKGRNTPEAVVLTVNSGKPGRLVAVADSATLLLQAVACGPNSRDCVAVGTNGSASGATTTGHGVVLSLSGGTPGPVQSVSGPPVALSGIACPTPSTCEAVGDTGGGGAALVVTLSTS